MTERGVISLHLVLTIFLGFGMALFGVLAVLAYQQNATTQANLTQIVNQAKADMAKEQKADDDVANTKANEDPYQLYTAEQVNGGFSVPIPKGWSIYAGKSPSADTSLDLIANPKVVNLHLAASAINTQAFHLKLVTRSLTEVNKAYVDRVKAKKLSNKATTVSGISGTWYEGAIDDQRHDGVVIVMQVRDKTMIISTESKTYLNEFNQILAGSKIAP